MNEDIKHLACPDNYDPLLNMDVSLEELISGGVIKNIPKFMMNLKLGLTNMSNIVRNIGQVPNYKKFNNAIKTTIYADLMNVSIHIPSGLVVKYTDYLDVLEKCVTVNENTIGNTLQPLALWLGENLSDPEKLNKTRSGISINGFVVTDLAPLKEELNRCFKIGSSTVKGPFKEYFSNFSEVETVYSRSDELVNRVISINLKTIKDKVNEISDKVNTLTNRIISESDLYQISESNQKTLSTLLYSVAEEVSFIGVICYQVSVLTNALERTKNVISK